MTPDPLPPPGPTPLTQAFSNRGIHYGWVIVAATFLTMMVGASAVGVPGVLIGPLQDEFGWSVADISAAFAIRFLLFGAVGPFAAAFLTRSVYATYLPAFYIAGIVCLIAAIAVFAIQKTHNIAEPQTA